MNWADNPYIKSIVDYENNATGTANIGIISLADIK